MTDAELLAIIEKAAAENETSLGLTGNGLTEIPAEISKLTKLTMLYLGFNKLEEIPESITNLVELTCLDLSFNQIEQIPEVVFSLKNLFLLSLYNNQIRSIPEDIDKLTNLTSLSLSYNQIREIPKGIVKLINLDHLNLSNNKIKEIPELLVSSTNLQITDLDLSSNKITQIPEEISNLTNLTKLNLANNQISKIPESLVNLQKLNHLDLNGNQIQNIPSELLDSKDAKKILNYLSKQNLFAEIRNSLLSDEIIKNEAIFTLDDLSRTLDPDSYPKDSHAQLIELMKEFEFCYALDCYPPKFLIPSILSENEPKNTDLGDQFLEFQYHYKVLPASIISRFIVITHYRIHNQTYWRSGVMLQYQENNEIYNIARIKADPEDKKIFIAISGHKETRRLFLGIIRDVFKRIHSTLPNLEITEWVPVPNHPNHNPLKYEDLIGLEGMGESHKVISELKLRLDLRQLLDGYESLESRQKVIRGDYIAKQVVYNQYGQGDNFAGDEVEGNKIG